MTEQYYYVIINIIMTEGTQFSTGPERQLFAVELPANDDRLLALHGLVQAFGGTVTEIKPSDVSKDGSGGGAITMSRETAQHIDNAEELTYLQKFQELQEVVQSLGSRPVLDTKFQGTQGRALNDRNKKPFTAKEQDKLTASGYYRVAMLGAADDNRRVTVYEDTVQQATTGLRIVVDTYNISRPSVGMVRSPGSTVTYDLGAAGGTCVYQGYKESMSSGVVPDQGNVKIEHLSGATIGNTLNALDGMQLLPNGYWELSGVMH
jgi:hypothetical protein